MRRRARPLFWFALVSAAYIGAAKLGIELPVAEGVITPVWAPSGIALAALLVLGLRYWPAVALGALVANVTSDASLPVAAGIAVGNTAAAVIGAALVRRLGFRAGLDRLRAVLALIVGGAVVSTAIAATNGVAVLALAGEVDSYADAWLLWWFGDAVGDLLVAPLVLVLYAHRAWRPALGVTLEGLALVAALAAVSAFVFLGGAWQYPYLIFPFLLWGALRFKQLGAATTSFVVAAFAIWGAVDGTIPIGADDATDRVQVVQALFALVAATLLVVGASLTEREEGREELLRTTSLLGEAQALAHVGSWEWDIGRDLVSWSDELYRIFGVAPGEPVTYASYLDRVHPEDRLFVDGAVQRAYAAQEPFAFEHRIVRPDGAERTISSRGRVALENGEPVRMLGTAQDVTERRRTDKLREDILSAVSHELRTPLTAVLGFAVTLEQRRQELPEAEVDEIVAELVSAAQRLERLLADLLDVERFRRGLLGVQRRPAEILELVERTVAACALDGRKIGIVGDPVTAEIDTPKVERIVENLVVNAAKHTPPGGAIELRVEVDGSDLLLAVDDEGPGVADEYKEAVFETFNRGANMLSATPGAGIGLALVARFAAVHGGRSWVEDRPGGGASFRVLLPGCVVADEPAAAASPAST